MWLRAGVFRDEAGLRAAESEFAQAWTSLLAAVERGVAFDAASWRLASLLTVGRLIVRAALRRDESRGAHHRLDHPASDDGRWLRHVQDARGAVGLA
jgi:succinate dehydrogenase/fumarate reductase flavoprotein subunit